MAQIPLWLQGRFCTSVVAQLQTVDPTAGTLANAGGTLDTASLVTSTGSVAAGTAVIVTGLVDSVTVRTTKQTEDISSVVETKAHHVAIMRHDTVELSEILRTGTNNCLLANLWTGGSGTTNASRIVFLTFARGGQKFSGWFVMEQYTEALRRGKTVGVMRLAPVDPGTTNAAFGTGDR